MLYKNKKPLLWGIDNNEHKTISLYLASIIAALVLSAVVFCFMLWPEQNKAKNTKIVSVVELKKIVKETSKSTPEPQKKDNPEKILKPKPLLKQSPKTPESIKSTVESLQIETVTEIKTSKPVADQPVADFEPIQTTEAVQEDTEISKDEAATPINSTTPESMDVGLACPKQSLPIIPRNAKRMGVSGLVIARLHIKSGKVVNVEIVKSTPPSLYDSAVINAVMQYECDKTLSTEIIATQNFAFEF